MNLIALSFKSIAARPLTTFLSWLLLTFGVTIVVLILLISGQLERQVTRNAQGIDLVVGAKGSPLQLILSCIFHVDFPTGNIDLTEAANLARNRYIGSAIPLSLGDSYAGYRIVGTTRAYPDLYEATLASGDWFGEHMETVIGSEVAKSLQLQPGNTFESQHGLSAEGDAHGGHPFIVKGVLQPTGTALDQLILTSVAAVWEVHGHEEEEAHHHEADSLVRLGVLGLTVTAEQLETEQITALLVKYKSPMGAVTLPRFINTQTSMQAASPAYEAARLFNILGVGVQILQILGLVIIIISAISMFIALIHSLQERKTDLAIMRTMGATRRQIFLLIQIEGVLITIIGAISGLVLAHGLMYILAWRLPGIHAESFYFAPQEGLVLAGCVVIGTVAALVPALMAYRADISKTLSKGS